MKTLQAKLQTEFGKLARGQITQDDVDRAEAFVLADINGATHFMVTTFVEILSRETCHDPITEARRLARSNPDAAEVMTAIARFVVAKRAARDQRMRMAS
jgi:hypothetical protein